jgi:Lrp/AsnC family leucine-responsive transcriptional regulator
VHIRVALGIAYPPAQKLFSGFLIFSCTICRSYAFFGTEEETRFMVALDKVDLSILRVLQSDGRISTTKVAEQLSLSETPCWRRQKRLEADGYIEGYQAIVSRRKIDLGVLSFIQLKISLHSQASLNKIESTLYAHPNVMFCHKVTGDADYLLQVVAKDLDEYGKFVTDIFGNLPGITAINSNISLQEIKSSSRFPIY